MARFAVGKVDRGGEGLLLGLDQVSLQLLVLAFERIDLVLKVGLAVLIEGM